MHDIKTIISGWKNYFKGEKLSPKIIALAEKRAAICTGCSHFVTSKIWNGIQMVAVSRISPTLDVMKGEMCDMCSCPFPTLLLAPEANCSLPWGQKKWFAENIEDYTILKIGDRVKIVKYGHLLYENKNVTNAFKSPNPVIFEDEINYYKDSMPQIVGRDGIISKVSVTQGKTQYIVGGIPSKGAWYDREQLELITPQAP